MNASPEPLFCRDMEQVAELFNNGYQEAMQHKTGGAEHRAWLVQTCEQIIHNAWHGAHSVTNVATQIADAILSEIDFDE